MSFSTNNLNNGVPATPACYAPRPRNRNSKSKPKPKPYTHTHHLPTPSPSASSSTSPSPPPVERWNCGLPGCTKTYGRVHDLVRHLDSAHHSVLRHADDSALLSSGIPSTSFARLRELLGKRTQLTLACAVCGESFSRSDALNRHLDEQGHRPIVAPVSLAPPAAAVSSAPFGYQWQLVPVSGISAPLPVPLHAPLPVPVHAPVPAPVWTPQLIAMPDPAPAPAPVDPLQSLLDEILAPWPSPASQPLLSDLHSFSPAPAPEEQFALFPLEELETLCETLCTGGPPPREEDIDAELSQFFVL